MPIIESSILVNRPAGDTYGFLKNLEAFPRFIAGVERIKVRRLSDRQVVSDWTIQVDGTPVSWREKDTFDDDTWAIKFKMLDGDFASYSGEWHVLEDGTSSRVSVALSIDWGVLNVQDEVAHVLERKARLAVRWMLRHLKKGLGHQTIIGQETAPDDMRSIVSELITYSNEQGQRIVGYHDRLKDTPSTDPFVVIPPGYGETKRDALSVAYYLAKNGFNVIRYDATNHVGESDGEMINTTLTRSKRDLIATLDFIEQNYELRRVGVVASSLAKRVAIKAAAEDKRISLLIGIVGVVDLRETLRAVYKEDMIGSCLEGKHWNITDVLGFEVSGHFLETAIADRFHDLESTIEDMRKLRIPAVFLVAENDAWVRLDQVRIVLESSRQPITELHLIPEALHRLDENPKAARIALRQIVASCAKYLRYDPIEIDKVLEPSLRELASQNKLEKERLKAKRVFSKDEERTFWEDYLSQYFILIKSPDYRSYLKDLSNALGPLVSDDTLLDAGCGNGHLGAWLLAESNGSASLHSQPPEITYTYVGVDLAGGALKEAQRRHQELLTLLSSRHKPTYSYLTGDIERGLELREGSFTKICCSLVLSYLNDPMAGLKELVRLLKPGGRLVVSSLKPHCDLSLIYRNFVDAAENEEEIQEGRRLLSNAGKIRQKESEGRYQFFSKTELTAMLAAAGLRSIRNLTSFGNQAYIVAGEKGLR